MTPRLDQIAERIYRISTFVPDIGPTGFTFNQFLVDADEPLLYHTGMRALFPGVCEAIARVLPVERLRWIAFAHVEADECGAMNEFLGAAPRAQVAHGALGCALTIGDQAVRPPRPLQDGEVLDLGSARILEVATPHVPHNWESHVFFEQETRTLFCGDLLSQVGDGPAIVGDGLLADMLDGAVATEAALGQTSLGPRVPATYRRLAALEPQRLAIMHGSSFEGDAAALLRRMADAYEQRFDCGPVSAAR